MTPDEVRENHNIKTLRSKVQSRLATENQQLTSASSNLSLQVTDWNRARWGWLRAVSGDGSISPMARLLACALVTNFSHHQTAHCAPGFDTLADALCTSVDTIKRAVRDLASAGWLIRTEGRGRGNRSEIFFLGSSNVVPMMPPRGLETSERDLTKSLKSPLPRHDKGGKAAPLYEGKRTAQKGADMLRKGGKSALSHIKAEPKNNQKAQTSACDASERPFAHHCAVAVEWSNGETEWNEWLAKHGLPKLRELGRKSSNRFYCGWDVPYCIPPSKDDPITQSISLKFFRWCAYQKGFIQ